MPKIIMNADDFGLNDNVNQSIVFCFNNNYISNTTVIANMRKSSEDTVRIAKENNFFHKVGLHLNLMEGIPLSSKIRGERLFCNEEGEFKGINLSSIIKACPSWVLRKSQREALSEEIEAQMRWYLDNGFTEMHIDSHQSTHSWNIILNTVLPLFNRYGFRTMRRRVDRGGNILIKSYEKAVNRIIPNSVVFLGDNYELLNRNALSNSACYEFMVHPVMKQKVYVDDVTGCHIDSINFGSCDLVSYEDL